MREEMKGLCEDLDDCIDLILEEMIKRFGQVGERFEIFDKRFETLTTRIGRFMTGAFATTLTVGGILIVAIKFLF